MPATDDLTLALKLADAADEISLARFMAADLRVDTKEDATPVSDADVAVEDRIRALLTEHRPTDAVLGEERERTGASIRQWVIDPIDGTKNYVRGVPIWATLIALVEQRDSGPEVLLGVVSAPALGRRWWAQHDGPAFVGGPLLTTRRLAVSTVADLEQASISYSSLTGWATLGLRAAFEQLLDGAWRTRAYGDFFSYMLLAEGAVDVAAEPELALHDMAALVPIVIAAGGHFTALDGTHGPFGGNAVATNGLLHQAVLKALQPRVGSSVGRRRQPGHGDTL